MVIETERFPGGGYRRQSYTVYQDHDDHRIPDHGQHYANFPSGIGTGHPPATYPTYPSAHAPPPHHHQSGWTPGGGDYYGDGANHYSGGGIPALVKPTGGGYGSPSYGNSNNHGSSPYNHGSNPYNHGGHGNPHVQSHGSSHSYGSAATNMLDKLTHGHGRNNYGGTHAPSYGHSPSGAVNYGDQRKSWVLKGLDDDE